VSCQVSHFKDSELVLLKILGRLSSAYIYLINNKDQRDFFKMEHGIEFVNLESQHFKSSAIVHI
jgi:hypothetical protein